ncbi:MAG TPA: transglutaminase-like domain-containing protein [Bacteroidales bacterium]|nr:transglutaminase-like domain-containing protein [Bacteroidales bacterium]
MTNNKNIKALFQLLDDPSTEVYHYVSKNILQQGEDIIPELEKVWETSFNEILQERIENLIQEIQFKATLNQLKAWKETGAKDIFEGAFWVAKYQYPELKVDTVKKTFDKIKRDAWLEINHNLTALEKIRVLNHIFYHIHGFSANSTNIHSPQNAFVNHVLDTKKGNPITLGILYMALANSLDIPLYGINLPKHFILGYADPLLQSLTNDIDILFYINPFNKGAVLGKREIDYFLKQQNIIPEKAYYYPCSNIDIIRNLVLNLLFSYEKLGYPEKVDDIKKMYNIIK